MSSTQDGKFRARSFLFVGLLLCIFCLGCGSSIVDLAALGTPVTLVFAPVASHTFGDTPFQVSASSASSGTITYSLLSGPASLSGNTVTLTGAGTVVVRASQAKDANFRAAMADLSFAVARANGGISFDPIPNHTFGDAPFPIQASPTTACSGMVTYTVTSGPATVLGNVVTLSGAGTVIVAASQAADANFNGSSAQAIFAVSVGTDRLRFNVISPVAFGDPPFTISARSSTASTGAIVYSVTSGPATITGDILTPTGAGTVSLHASQAADSNFGPASVDTSFTISKGANDLSFAAISAPTYGDPPLTVSAASTGHSTGSITYAVVSGSATIAGRTVTITGGGAVVLSATQAADANYLQGDDTVSFTVARKTNSLTFNPIAAHNYGDPPFAIQAVSGTASTGAITYAVISGPATVSGNMVTITGSGPLTLSATQAADTNFRSATTQASLTIPQPSGSLAFDPIAVHTYGEAPFAIQATSKSPAPILYSVVSGPATISGQTVTVTGAGTVVVQASQDPSAPYAAATIQSTFAVGRATPTLTFNSIAPFIDGDPPFKVSASSTAPVASSGAITFSVVSGPATIDADVVTVTDAGTVVLAARQAASTNYTPATAQVSFTSAVANTSPVGLIDHVVIIFQENVSFDHYFGTYPNAANLSGEPVFTALPGTPSIDGYTTDLLTNNPNSKGTRNGAGATNPFRLARVNAATADQGHSYSGEQMAFNGGAMNLFPYSVGVADGPGAGTPAAATTSGLTMGYFDGNTVTAEWNYAQHFAMSDRFFATVFGPSTPGAINLISGQTNGVINDNNGHGSIVSDGYSGFTMIADPDPVTDICSSTNAGLVHMTGKNIGDLLNTAGISWGFFESGFDLTVSNPNGSTGCRRTHTSAVTGRNTVDYIPHHQPFQYYASTANPTHVRPTSTALIGKATDGGANHQYDSHDFFDAIKAGNFPTVSFLKAPGYQDGHAGYSDPLDEQVFVVNAINAIQQTPQWPRTVILIAYDDSDGWYDHAFKVINGSVSSQDQYTSTGKCADGTTALPGVAATALHAQGRCGYGPRLPLLAISPWARPNYVDSNLTDQTSILRFIEDTFLNKQRIGQGSFDSISGEINGLFDFRRTTPQNSHILLLDEQQGTVTSFH